MRLPAKCKERDMIVKSSSGGRTTYSVRSESHPKKRLGGPYKTRAEAEKRLRQVEFFKHHGKKGMQ